MKLGEDSQQPEGASEPPAEPASLAPSAHDDARTWRRTLTAVVDKLDRRSHAVLAAMIGLQLVIGFVYSSHIGRELRFLDEEDYLIVADNLVRQHQYIELDVLAFRPPLYSMFLAVGRFFGASVTLLRFANFALLGLSMWLLFRLVTIFARPSAALLAVAWVFAYPVFVYCAGTLYAQTLASTLLIAFVALIARPPRGPSHAMSFAAGLIFGLLVLAMPGYAPLLGVAAVWLHATRRPLGWGRLLLLAAGAAVPIGYWTVRNYWYLHEWFFISTNAGFNFLLGNSENTRPSLGSSVDIQRYLEGAAGRNEVGRDRYLREQALRWIADHPGAAAQLYVGKFLHYFSMNDELATSTEARSLRQLVATASYLPFQAAVLLRLWLSRRFPMHALEKLVLAMYLANAFFAAAIFTRVRLRLPVDLLLLVLFGGLASLAFRHWFGPEKQRPPEARAFEKS